MVVYLGTAAYIWSVFLERRIFSHTDKDKKAGIWISADKWIVDSYPILYPEDYKGDGDNVYTVPCHDYVYNGRNYNLFAILANVRNGRGFAGCDTGDGFIPIDMPRGLPIDVSPQVDNESNGWGVDGHSHSWFTLEELLEYDWEGKKTKHRGRVGENDYKIFKEKGHPESWSGFIDGASIRKVTNLEMNKIIEGKIEREKISINGEEIDCTYVTQIEWEESYAESCRTFTDETLSKLRAMVGNKYGTLVKREKDLRVVFWFDN